MLKPGRAAPECEQSGNEKLPRRRLLQVCFKFIVPVLLAFILFCQLIDFFGLKIPGLGPGPHRPGDFQAEEVDELAPAS